MKYLSSSILIITLSISLFLRAAEAKNEQAEGQIIKVPSEYYHYLVQKETEAQAYSALNKELVTKNKMVNDLMSELIKTSKERKTSSKKHKKDDEISQTHVVNEIVNIDRETSFNDAKMESKDVLFSPSSSQDQKALIVEFVKAVKNIISEKDKIISEQKSRISDLENRMKESTQKNTPSSLEKEKVLSMSTSQIVEVPQVHKALVVSDPTDISVKKSVVSLSESALSHNSVPSIPRVTPALTIENQGMQFLDPKKPRLLEEDLFSHTILFPRPKFEMEKRSISLDPLLAEYTASKLFTEQIPEEHFFVDERITTSIDPFIPQFESSTLKMEKAHTLIEPKPNEFEMVTGIPISTDEAIFKHFPQTFSFQENEDDMMILESSNYPNDLSELDHPRSPSLHIRRESSSQPDLQEFFTQQILSLSNTIDAYKEKLQDREEESRKLAQKLEKEEMDKYEQISQIQKKQRIQLTTQFEKEKEELLDVIYDLNNRLEESPTPKECRHCKEASHALNLIGKQNEEFENKVLKLQTHLSSVDEIMHQKQEHINTLLTQFHQQEEELLEVHHQNIFLTQENLQKKQEVEDDKEFIQLLKAQVVEDKEDNILISNLLVKLKNAKLDNNDDSSSMIPQKDKKTSHRTMSHNRVQSLPSYQLEDIFNKHLRVILIHREIEAY